MIEAFRKDWEVYGLTLAEMAALYGFRNVNSVTRAARRIGLKARPGGPKVVALTGGRWEASRGGVRRWVADQPTDATPCPNDNTPARLAAGNAPGANPGEPRKASQMATIQAIIVETDGTFRETQIENSLGAFQAVVGGYIEGVFGKVGTVYVNEEGLLRSLPFNPLATLFANRILGQDVRLHGAALLVGPADTDGYDTDVRPAVVDYFTMEG